MVAGLPHSLFKYSLFTGYSVSFFSREGGRRCMSSWHFVCLVLEQRISFRDDLSRTVSQ